jgi:signal transduction histidine kinase
MINSLRVRLLLAMAAVLAVTAGSVALLARQSATSGFQHFIQESEARDQQINALLADSTLLLEQSAEERQQALQELQERLGSRVVILNENNNVIADSQADSTDHSQILSEQHILRIERHDLNDGPPSNVFTVELQPIDGTSTQHLYPTIFDGANSQAGQQQMFIANSPNTNKTLRLADYESGIYWTAIIQNDPLQNRFVTSLENSLLIAVALASIVALVLTWLLSERILAPVAALTKAAQRLEGGDLSQRVEVKARDEIASLAYAFNSMADTLERTEALRRTMVSDIAHELRTPLTNIRGYLEGLRDGVVEADLDTFDSLHEEALLLNRLIDDLQELALAEAGQLRLNLNRCDISSLLRQSLLAAQPRLSQQALHSELKLANDLPELELDAERMGQVLRNLLNNALTHTSVGGTIRLIAEQATDQTISIRIEDTGSGVPADDLPFIFERFYRADRSRNRATGGAGLGLTIVKQLVEAHGGTISVNSQVGEGSSFQILLPINPKHAAIEAVNSKG